MEFIFNLVKAFNNFRDPLKTVTVKINSIAKNNVKQIKAKHWYMLEGMLHAKAVVFGNELDKSGSNPDWGSLRFTFVTNFINLKLKDCAASRVICNAFYVHTQACVFI